MKALEGKLGRIFVLRFEENEILPKAIEEFANKKRIKAGIVFIIGGTKSGKLITGPKETEAIPTSVIETSFISGREMLGIGTLFKNETGKISLHMHIASGRNKSTFTGCIRKGIKVFLIAEAVIFEIKGIKVIRKKDIYTGFNLLTLVGMGN